VTFLSDRSERFSDSQAIFSRWAQTFSGRGPSAGAGWKSALHGDREVMFKVVMTVVICPGAEAKRCEWWIENMQRQDVHRRREFVQRLARLFF